MRVIKKPVAFETMYKDVRTKLGGMSSEEAENDWEAWRRLNPKFGVGGDDGPPQPGYRGPVFPS